MSVRKLLIILGVVAVLLGLAVVKKGIQKKEAAEEEKTPSFAEVELVKNLPAQFVSKIEVYKGGDPDRKLVFVKDNGGAWVVASKFGVKTRKDAVENLLKEFTDIKGELRAESESVFPDFKIGDKEGLHVLLQPASGKPLADLVVGLRKPGWNKSFVRLEGSRKIVLVPKDILMLFRLFGEEAKLDTGYAADLKIFSFDPKLVEKISLATAGSKGPLVLKKSLPAGSASAVWSFEPPGSKKEEVDASKADQYLKTISRMAGRDVFDPKLNTYGLQTPALEVTLQDAQGAQLARIEVGASLDGNAAYYAKAQPAGFVYKISAADLNNLKHDRTFFLKQTDNKKR
jgi:hypothetical protein